MTETTDGTLLNGRIGYRQTRAGHRSGFEPVLLAASIPATPESLVLELGTGAGASLLCLAARVPGVAAAGIELEAATVALASFNFKNNGFQGLHAVRADAANPPFGRIFDHVLANPPWHDPAGTPSPDPRRRLAHHAGPNLLQSWITAMAGVLKPRGTLHLIMPAPKLAAAMAALAAAGHGRITILPLWPRAHKPAGQVIIAAGRGNITTAIRPGLVLHDANGITAAAQAILRDGAAI